MTNDEFSKSCKLHEIVKEIRDDLMARTDLDTFGQAHRALSVAKLDLVLTEIEGLQNLHFIGEYQKVVDACAGNKE